MHCPATVVSVYLPGIQMQTSLLFEPVAYTVLPVGQLMQCALPVVPMYLPLGQLVHETCQCSEADWNCPAAHERHCAAIGADEYVPVHVLPYLLAATVTVLPDNVPVNVVPSPKEPLTLVPLMLPVPA